MRIFIISFAAYITMFTSCGADTNAVDNNDGKIHVRVEPARAYNKCLLHSIVDHNVPAQTFENCMNIGIKLCNKIGMKTDAQTQVSPITGMILLSNQQCAYVLEHEFNVMNSAYESEMENCLSYQRVGMPCKPIVSPDSVQFECDDKCKESAKSDYDECLTDSVKNGDNLSENFKKCDVYSLTWCDAMGWPTYDHPPYETYLSRTLSGLPMDNRCNNASAAEVDPIINKYGNEKQKKALIPSK